MLLLDLSQEPPVTRFIRKAFFFSTIVLAPGILALPARGAFPGQPSEEGVSRLHFVGRQSMLVCLTVRWTVLAVAGYPVNKVARTRPLSQQQSCLCAFFSPPVTFYPVQSWDAPFALGQKTKIERAAQEGDKSSMPRNGNATRKATIRP